MLKLALISDFPPYKCGIANYTGYLADALNSLGLFDMCVISEGGRQNSTFPVYDTYSRKGDFRHDIVQKVTEIKPDVVHIQHALVLFPDTDEFLKMIEEISRLGIKVFVTLHTADIGRNIKIDWEKFYRTVLEYGHLIVHNEMCLNSVKHYGIPTEKVHVIPHGTAFFELPDKTEARKKLGLPADEFIFLILGFIHLLKNHHTVIMAFRAMRSAKKCRLLIAGMADRNTWNNRLYVFVCRILSLFSKQITWHNVFVKNEDLPVYFACIRHDAHAVLAELSFRKRDIPSYDRSKTPGNMFRLRQIFRSQGFHKRRRRIHSDFQHSGMETLDVEICRPTRSVEESYRKTV